MLLLDYKIVSSVAEELIEKNGSTTTLDVKNALRNKNYQATQNEVSGFMSRMAIEESLHTNQNQNFKIYSFAMDSKEKLNGYFQKDDTFWAIKVENATLIIEEGKINTTGILTEKLFKRNIKAIKEGKELIKKKEIEGFFKTPDTRLPLNIRKSIGGYENKKLKKIILSFFNVIFETEENIVFVDNKEEKKGLFMTKKQGGYQFAWETNLKEVEKITKTSNQNLEISQFQFDYYQTTGEKINQKYIVDEIGNTIHHSVNIITQFNIKNHILIDLKNLYIAELFFETGEKLNLSKFDYESISIFFQVINNFE
ncbi:MAG: hypothetical protein EAZ44_01750 [Cytophagia bacterium]|nr:MAG: hypothetical protein EAY69_07235 [Cytophagales bacterium]TAG06695.1 MAG: hypothetical protein EAZ44_01750 [Cytophagia bacterium]TAH30530.1 MAG: hypothetical protein EAZ06_02890 [Cytophagales bacterium]